jgi:hypothetical protein
MNATSISQVKAIVNVNATQVITKPADNVKIVASSNSTVILPVLTQVNATANKH